MTASAARHTETDVDTQPEPVAPALELVTAPATELVFRQGFGWVERPVATRTLGLVDPL